jgi:hypothetical protein
MSNPKRAASVRLQEDAVTAVVATVLLVAVTLLLGSAVLIASLQLSGKSPPPPTVMGFQAKEGSDSIFVTHGAKSRHWDEIKIKMSVPGGAAVGQDPAPGLIGLDLQAGAYKQFATRAPIQAGDQVRLCADGGAASVEVILVDTVSQAILFRTTFATIAQGNC